MEQRLTILGAPKLRMEPIIDLRLSSFGIGLDSKVPDVGVFGLAGVSSFFFGVDGTLLADVLVRYRSKDVGGGLEPPAIRSTDDRFILGVYLLARTSVGSIVVAYYTRRTEARG